MKKTAIELAVFAAGGQSALAKKLGLNHQVVQSWVSKNRVPADRVLAVEAAVNDYVSRYELRPDVYGPFPTEQMLKKMLRDLRKTKK